MNHWPRSWYRLALTNPKVKVTAGGETRDYLAVRVTGEEEDYLHERFPMSLGAKFQMGFPPRRFVRLDTVN